MPVAYRIDTPRRLIRAKIEGNLTAADMLLCVNEIAPELGRNKFDMLSDHREIATPATREQLEMLVARLSTMRATLAGMNWAVVVGKPSSYGMMRMLRVLAQRVPIRVEIFESVSEAEIWLDAVRRVVSEKKNVPTG